MYEWHKKEAPLLGLQGSGGGLGFLAGRGGAADSAGITATGGTKEENVTVGSSRYTYHFFTTPGPQPFNVTDVSGPGQVEYIIIGGGGPGGYSQNGDTRRGGGGGGAGGLITNFIGHPYYPRTPGNYAVTAQNYSFNVGAVKGATGPNAVTPGNPSSAFGFTAEGGGGGGQNEGQNASGGGSGGGAGAIGNSPSNYASALNGDSQGNPGGSGSSNSGGGGGGAGAAGTNASVGPNGGVGSAFTGDYAVPNSYGTPGPSPGRWFCGGGSGGTYPSGYGVGPGGAGGGGAGGTSDNTGSAGTNNTGGGGGGAGGGPLNTSGGDGGSGIIIIRYLT